MRIAFLILVMVGCASGASAQKIEPVRTMSGWMIGNRITVSTIEGRPAFKFQLTGAEIKNGHLSLSLANSESGKPVEAILVGSLAQSSNPWPGSGERSRNTDRVPEQPNEQTQSLYSAAQAGTGCEVIFLRMETPRAVQVGVVVKRQDNKHGGEINQAICRVVRALDAKADTSAPVKELNNVLAHQ